MAHPETLDRLVRRVAGQVRRRRAEHYALRGAFWSSLAAVVVISLVVGRGLMMTGAGLLVGIGGAVGVGRLLRSFLFGITPADPMSILGSGACMLAAALFACYLPARRASRADPVDVLRVE